MILKDKTILIMGLRNKWSIAWGVAKSACEHGANVIFTYNSVESEEKTRKLIEEIPNAKLYRCDASNDESIKKCLEQIKQEHGKIDGILHAIAHAYTHDLRNDFRLTTRDGFAHACDVSAYSLISIANNAKELDLLNDDASIVALSYYGAEKAVLGYNVMGAAKAALESSVRYLAMDLGQYGYRVNAISAGPIKTLSAKGIKDFGSMLDIVEEKSALRKNVTAKQVGDTATFLFSNLSSAITGEVLHVDNGYSIAGI